jgi:hypothetical protein
LEIFFNAVLSWPRKLGDVESTGGGPAGAATTTEPAGVLGAAGAAGTAGMNEAIWGTRPPSLSDR